METNHGISDADCRSDQRKRDNKAASLKTVIATPDSAGVQRHFMLWQSYFCGCALNCIAMTSEVAWRLEPTGSHWPEEGAIPPLTLPTNSGSRCIPSWRRAAGTAKVPWRFPCPGAVPRECRTRLFPSSVAPRGPLTINCTSLHGSDNGADVIGRDQPVFRFREVSTLATQID